MKIAYLLIAHKAANQINMFIEQLTYYGECDIYIHVDKKNSDIVEKINKKENVFIYSEYNVRWGSFEIVKAAIFLMRKALAAENTYSHMYFGSGQDIIVRKGLYEFLEENPGKIFIKIHGKITDKDRESSRYRVKWPKKLMIRNDWHIYRIIRIFIQLLCVFGLNVFPNKKVYNCKLEFFHGRTWFVAPYSVIEYIISFIDDNQDFVDFWEDSLASDLMFFQTIIMNSKYADHVRDELMYVEFGKTFGTMNHPLVISSNRIKKIENKRYYFARKVDLNVDENVIEYFNKVIKDE